MIFKQIDEIVCGTKTQTRRIVKPNEGECVNPLPDDHRFFQRDKMYVAYPATETREITRIEANGRLKWTVGSDYAVSPGSGKPGVWWNPTGEGWTCERKNIINQDGWRPLRIRITAIRQERLQDISLGDVKTEGIQPYTFARGIMSDNPPDPRWKYIELWDSLNTRKGTRWQDNPLVWVLTFEVVA